MDAHPVMEMGDDSESFNSEDENAIANFFLESSGEDKQKAQEPEPASQPEPSPSPAPGAKSGGRLLMKRTINRAENAATVGGIRATMRMPDNAAPGLFAKTAPTGQGGAMAQSEVKRTPEVGKRPVVRQLGSQRVSAPHPPMPPQACSAVLPASGPTASSPSPSTSGSYPGSPGRWPKPRCRPA